MELGLRKRVISSDGKHIGHVDGLVLDYNTRDVESFVVRSGVLLEHDRLISRGLIDNIAEDGTVKLSLSAEQVKKLPEFFEREFQVAQPSQLSVMPDEWVGMGTGAPPVYFGTGSDSLGYGQQEPFFGAAPVIPPEVEIESNLPEQDIIIDAGTDVIGSDGRKIGDVDEVTYGPDGRVTGFVVRAGVFVHHDLSVPVEEIASVGEDHVRLKITAEEAKQHHSAP